MAIAGGAAITPLRGVIVDVKKSGLIDSGMDAVSATATASTFGYWILLPFDAFILYYALSGHKAGLKEVELKKENIKTEELVDA